MASRLSYKGYSARVVGVSAHHSGLTVNSRFSSDFGYLKAFQLPCGSITFWQLR